MTFLKQVITVIVLIKLLFDSNLRTVSILVLMQMIRKVAIPIVILGGLIVFATSKAKGDDWSETFEQGQEKYLEIPTDEIETDWLLSYECARFQRGWSDHRPKTCPIRHSSDGESDQEDEQGHID